MPTLDAVFCNNDDLALGVLFECHRASINVPQTIGIAGFNDLDMMQAAFPSITSVRTHRYEIGRRAVAMARARIDGEQPSTSRSSISASSCSRRESTARDGASSRVHRRNPALHVNYGSATISVEAGLQAFRGLFPSYYMINE